MFKEFQGPNLSNEEVTSVLEEIQKNGWDVSYEKHSLGPIYRIQSDNKEVKIQFHKDGWIITSTNNGSPKFVKRSNDLISFKKLISTAGASVGFRLNLKKTVESVRLHKTKPLSNKIQIIKIADGRCVTKIFDPYFDTKSILTLHSLKSLGLIFGENVQCLTSKNISNIDEDVYNAFALENSLNFEIKKCTPKEHRRFFVLNDNSVIIIGCSLNDIDKNEVIMEEKSYDLVKGDLDYFADEWKK